MKVTEDTVYQEEDIIEIIEKFQKEYRTIGWTHLDGQIYIYKPLGRKDYKELCEDEEMPVGDKEDKVVTLCVLYPYNLDIDNMLPGVFNKLYETIMENSCLKSIEDRANILNYYRNEMFDSFNQIPCIINEAFPQYDIEDIENWDVERTAKYLSRAEWKLEVFHNIVTDYSQTVTNAVEEQKESTPAPTENKRKSKLTPEELARLKAKIPEIDWEHDTLLTEGEEAMAENVSSIPVGLRTPDQLRQTGVPRR